MKPTAVLLTVILLSTGMFSCITKDKPNTYISDDVLPEIPLKKADTALIPQPDHKEADSTQIVKVKYTAPKRYIMIKKEDAPDCGGSQMPAEDNSDTVVWRKVEIEAEYPGGAAAWQRFLNRNLRYPQEAIDNEINGSVVVQFIVDEEGNVSNVEAVSGPEVLCTEMIRVIKKSGKWTPAVQNGRQVRSLKKQPICIHLETEG
jgi:periplasmic protein TonB